jgi:antitoxin component YwqK of YwqJK toxin-antitoxin module
MKKVSVLFVICVFSTQLYAISVFEQLCVFNYNWKNYPMQCSVLESGKPLSEREYVQLHLSHVIPILQTNDVPELSVDQLSMRIRLIEVLDGYRIAGEFPLNEYVHERIPVFIDKYDTYCAVGYLMRASGYNDLARAISADNNLAWVKEIRVEGLAAWQELSGFSLEELKLIQGAYDIYYPDAYLLPNKYEVPQKPEVVVRYFDDARGRQPKDLASATIWCKGEGRDGILHGKWTQNYSSEFPWIEGFYSHGKRTGQWKEYYPGTNLLCRTENWRGDKLNGIRKRFDREGKIIEEIMFSEGIAVTKTNYDFVDSVYHVRKPIDSAHVSTEVFTFGGRLLAAGNERVYNPGNLKWFQNIELTALNSAILSTQQTASNSYDPYLSIRRPFELFGSPSLVEYFKEGDWKFYPEGQPVLFSNETTTLNHSLSVGFLYYAEAINKSLVQCYDINVSEVIDSLHVRYNDNTIQDFKAFTNSEYVQLNLSYYPETIFLNLDPYGYFSPITRPVYSLMSIAQYNRQQQRVGTWKYFNQQGEMTKKEMYLIPEAENESDNKHAELPMGDAWKR